MKKIVIAKNTGHLALCAIYSTSVLIIFYWVPELNVESLKKLLKEIEIEAMNLCEVCCKEASLYGIALNLINQSAKRLEEEGRKADHLLQAAVAMADPKGSQSEFTRISSQVLHDITSPLAVLETIAQSTLLELAEEIRNIVRSSTSRIRNAVASFKK